jgi:Cu(I)/Ag(I) efflux system protein CusF
MKHLPLLIALSATAPLHAAPVEPHAAPSTATAPQSEGTVRKIDQSVGKITLRHGPIANLDMPPMTMVFVASPPELLNKIKVGDSVKFRAEEIGGVYTVTAIEKMP